MKLKTLLPVLVLTSVFCVASFALAQTMTDAQRQALIAQIQQEIASLTLQLQQMLAQQQGNSSWCYTFNTNIGYANSGTQDVVNLHLALQQQGISYSPDDINTYNTGTSNAVIQFQTKYGITPQSGYVGNLTRAKLNQLYECSSTQNTTQNTNTTNTNNCNATCVTQSDGTYAIDCSGNPQKCDSGEICQQTYDTSYTYNNGGVQTVKNLTGSECTTQTSCTPNWQCSGFGTCASGQQTQTCTDSNNCGVTTNEPATSQSCTSNCTPNWSCSGFSNSSCVNGQQTQTCTDSNNCGVTANEPALTQSCTATAANTCAATCVTQSDGIYAIDCYGNPQKCYSGEVCQKTYNTTYTYNNGGVQTIQTLTGSECTTPSTCSSNSDCSSGQTCSNGSCTTSTTTPGTCTPNWSCTGFSACNNGQQTQTCTDSNNCGTTANEPALTQSCNLSSATVDLKVNGSDGPLTVSSNSTSTLSWSSTNANSCSASATNTNNTLWSGSQPTSGTKSLGNLTSSGTYTITCADSSGNTVSDSVTVNIIKVDLKINNSDGPTTPPFYTVPYNSTIPFVLTWSSTGATSCTASSTDTAWSGSQPTSGTKTLGQIASSTTYTITCKDSAGNTATDSVFINISKPSVSLTANGSAGPIYLDYGTSFTLAWTATNAASCSASATWNDSTWGGQEAVSGSFSWVEAIEATNTYTITCSDSAGNTATSSVFVRSCSSTTMGATGYLGDTYGSYANSCTSYGSAGQATIYTCQNGKVINQYNFCQQGCNGNYSCKTIGYLPAQ